MQSPDLITFAFSLFNALRLVSYFPQIIAVAQCRHGAAAISVSCWSIWIGANASAAVYAWVRLGDTLFAMMSAFNTACCLMVVSIALYKRIIFWRRARSVPVTAATS